MLKIWREIALGFRTYARAFAFIRKHRLRHFYLYPLLMTLLLSLGAMQAIKTGVEAIETFAHSYWRFEQLPDENSFAQLLIWLQDMGHYVFSILLWIFFYLIYFKFIKYLVLICMSPVMAILAERTADILECKKQKFSWSQFIKDVFRGMLIALRNMFYELFLVIVVWSANLFISFLIPPLSFISTPFSTLLVFVIGAYYYGFSTLDYSNERRRKGVSDGIEFIRRHKGLAIANGSVFSLWLLMPFFGTYIGTVVATVSCTVAATMAYHSTESKDKQEEIALSASELRS